MRSYVSLIGYDSARVTRPVLSHGLATNDRLTLLRPVQEMDDNRASQAVGDVRQMLNQIEPEVSIALKEVPHDDFEQGVRTICDLLQEQSGRVVVNLSGGARDLFAMLLVASLVNIRLIDSVLAFSDIDGNVRELALPDMTVAAPQSSFTTLRQINRANGPVSISELTESRDLAKSTVTRHLKQLEQRNLVETWQEGKSKYASPTFSGELLIRSYS